MLRTFIALMTMSLINALVNILVLHGRIGFWYGVIGGVLVGVTFVLGRFSIKWERN